MYIPLEEHYRQQLALLGCPEQQEGEVRRDRLQAKQPLELGLAQRQPWRW